MNPLTPDYPPLSMNPLTPDVGIEQDGHLRHKLMTILKLSDDKWNEAKDHANRAVVTDNRLRAW